ncbi:MAG: hypothetical protein LUD18_04405 [Lachnospiraceae bacterium]|nr:hypothetical protein [Lachnospiraceae bacterium]
MITDRYYYMRLSEPEKRIYQVLYKGVKNLEEEIVIDGIHPDMDTVNRIYDALTADNPLLYYFNQSLLTVHMTESGTIFVPQYFCSREQIATYNGRIQTIVNQLMMDLQLEQASDSEKVRRIHDYFCLNIMYDREALHSQQLNWLIASHSIIGVFAKKRAVCEGISKAVKLLLNTANVKCIVVNGNAELEENIPHMWNIVKIDGVPYHLDVTWDLANSKDGRICYDYYCLSDALIQSDHSDYSGIPSCGSESENYFARNNLLFQDRRGLAGYVSHGLLNHQKDFYFRYVGKESIESVVHELVELISNEMKKMEQKARIRSMMNPAQRIGRIFIEMR